MYVVSLNYICDISDVEQHLEDHIRYLEKQYSAGYFLASGRKVPRTGGVILAKADSRDELEQILAEDPFKKNKVADYVVTEFVASKTAPELSALLEN